MISRVLLYPNTSRDIGLIITRQAATLLRSEGVEPILPRETEGFESLADVATALPLAEALTRAELIVTLGGDGTILRIAKEAAEQVRPILGIQMGRLGFLAELDAGDVEKLRAMARGDFTVDERMMLALSVICGETLVHQDLALNEALLTGGATRRFITLSVYADRQEMMSFSGDGVIVSTPTGSTAYCLSAGGPIVEPGAESMTVTPVCAHAFYARAIVLSPNRMVTVRSHQDEPVYLNVDGKGEFAFLPEYRLEIRRALHKTRLIHIGEHNFFGLIGEKFRG